MRIALLAPLRFPIAEPYAGGLEAHTHHLARGLRDLGHAVTLFAHPASDASFPIVPFRVETAWPVLGLIGAYRAAMRAVRAGAFDVAHNNSIHFWPPLAARRLACPMVSTMHTPPYKLLRWTARLAARHPGHHYVAISEHLQRQWLPYAESEVIHNGASLSRFSFAPAPPASGAQTDTAIWFGRILPDKAPHLAARACSRAGFSLDLAGPIEDRAYFDAEIAPLLTDRIRYVGHLSQASLARAIGRASVGLVTPVWDEPFGLACVEILACGTPVAGFDSGALPEIITPECGVLVPKGDDLALSQVLSMVGNSNREKCRERAERFSLEAMARAYEATYMRVRTRKF